MGKGGYNGGSTVFTLWSSWTSKGSEPVIPNKKSKATPKQIADREAKAAQRRNQKRAASKPRLPRRPKTAAQIEQEEIARQAVLAGRQVYQVAEKDVLDELRLLAGTKNEEWRNKLLKVAPD